MTHARLYNVGSMPAHARSFVCALAIAGLTLAFTGVTLGADPARHAAGETSPLAKIAPSDRAALLLDALDGEASFLVVLDRQADLRAASGLHDRAAKGRFVFEALRAVAAEAQPELIAALQAQGAAVRPLVIVNAIAVRGSLLSLLTAAGFERTLRIVADTPVSARLPSPDRPPHPSALILQPSSVEWGVNAVNAPAVWSMGYTGGGIVVGGQDTGVLWNHDALKAHYRGWNGASAEHDFNWHDAIHLDVPGSSAGNPCGFSLAAPCDDHGHGTHTLGSVVGDDAAVGGAGNHIGVAPGAQWTACRNMDGGWGAPSTYLECFEWFLAPYPLGGTIAEGDPARAPHIVTNSWSCPATEGCLTGQEILSGVLTMRAAGILTVVAATNYGTSGCSSIDEPPAIYAEAFTIGAFDSAGSVASFSSRRPVMRDGSRRTKPDIAAPGVSVRSATNASPGSYTWLSGTSMATPHVAGVAALLWDAAPHLVGEVDLTEWVLRLNATPAFTMQACGGDAATSRPNNVWGWGKLDALAAVSATFSLTPTAALTHTLLPGNQVVLDASASSDPETPADRLLARWDFGGDGVWDTPWSFDRAVTASLDLVYPAAVVQVADWGGRTAAAAWIHPSLDRRTWLPIVFKGRP